MTLPPPLSRMPLLLTLLLLAPRVGLAEEQTPRPPSDAPTEQRALSDTPPLATSSHPDHVRLLDTPSPETERPSTAARVAAELGASVLTGVGGLVLGYISTFVLGLTGSGSLYALALPTLVGTGVGIALGTYWGGQVMDGESSLGSSFLGMLLGGVAGLLLSLPMGNPTVGLLLAPPLMVLGSIIGYEHSEHGGTKSPRVQPLLSVTPHGATLGLAASF